MAQIQEHCRASWEEVIGSGELIDSDMSPERIPSLAFPALVEVSAPAEAFVRVDFGIALLSQNNFWLFQKAQAYFHLESFLIEAGQIHLRLLLIPHSPACLGALKKLVVFLALVVVSVYRVRAFVRLVPIGFALGPRAF